MISASQSRAAPDSTWRPAPPRWALALRNRRMMQLLHRIAGRFNEAGVPLMTLKGAALQLLLYDRADARAMDDLDLMVRPEHSATACRILQRLGGQAGPAHAAPAFFPRFYYETEHLFGAAYPVKVDLHVRPFRPLRYAVTVPAEAFWDRAVEQDFGGSRVLVPSPEDMLLHLAVHAAVHGTPRGKWMEDLRLWITTRGTALDWEMLRQRAEAWRLTLPLTKCLRSLQSEHGALLPESFLRSLERASTSWRDRLALWQAPRDAAHPFGHVATNVLCTPDALFAGAYLAAVLFPNCSPGRLLGVSAWLDYLRHALAYAGLARHRTQAHPTNGAVA